MKHSKVGQESRGPQQRGKMAVMGLRLLPSVDCLGGQLRKDASPEPGGTCGECTLVHRQSFAAVKFPCVANAWLLTGLVELDRAEA